MANLGFSQILELVEKAPNDEQRVSLLRQHDSRQMRMLFQYAFDSRVVWLLPETNPPYQPTTYLDQERRLFGEMDKLFYYVKSGADNLRQFKREQMFIQLLEGVHPKDAVLLLAVKNKQVPYPHITPALVKTAYPDLDLIWDETRNFDSTKGKKAEKKEEQSMVTVEVPKKKRNTEWWNTPAGLLAKERLKAAAAASRARKANGKVEKHSS